MWPTGGRRDPAEPGGLDWTGLISLNFARILIPTSQDGKGSELYSSGRLTVSSLDRSKEAWETREMIMSRVTLWLSTSLIGGAERKSKKRVAAGVSCALDKIQISCGFRVGHNVEIGKTNLILRGHTNLCSWRDARLTWHLAHTYQYEPDYVHGTVRLR